MTRKDLVVLVDVEAMVFSGDAATVGAMSKPRKPPE